MVKDHSGSERRNPLPSIHGLLFPIDSTYEGVCFTSRGELVGTRNSSTGPPCGIDPTIYHTTIRRRRTTSRSSTIRVKGSCIYYSDCEMVHIKEPLLLIGESSPCGGSGFTHSLCEWSFTICPTPYSIKQNMLSVSLNKTFPCFLLSLIIISWLLDILYYF